MSNKAQILREIRAKINDFLYKSFYKTYDYYATLLFEDVKYANQSMFHVIADVEQVEIETIYQEIKTIVISTFREYEKQDNTFKPFIFFADDVSEEKLKEDGYDVEIWSFIPEENSHIEQLILSIPNFAVLIKPLLGAKSQTENIVNLTKAQQLFNDIVTTGIIKNASDIHIMNKPDEYHVYYRIDGLFIHEPKFTMDNQTGLDLLHYMMYRAAREVKGSTFNPDTRLIHQDARITFDFSDTKEKISLRVAFTPDGISMEHMKTTIRILRTKSISLDTLSIKRGLEEKGYQVDITEIQKNPLTYTLISMGYFEEDAF
ncbi:MAG TPA: hypothetical protein ENO30_05005, partial [Thermodesulfobium narugense]|nr:hypothetical protein [Thermodesulfobium narugense]